MVLKDIGECLTRRVTKNLKQALHRAILVLRLGHKPFGCLEHIFNSCGHCGCALHAHASAAAAAAAATSAQQLQHIYTFAGCGWLLALTWQ